MKLVIAYDCIFPATTGGGERQYRAFAEEFADLGYEVEYLTAEQEIPREDLTFAVTTIAPRLRLYDDDGVRSSVAAVRFAWGLFRALRRRRGEDVAIVSGLPLLNVLAARAALLGSRTRLIIDYLEVWGRPQWVEYAGRAKGNLAWIVQRVALWATPTATCHSDLSARRLRSEGYRGKLLISPGLISGASNTVFSAEATTPPYALYAGRHIADKRVETIPAAVQVARRQIPELQLVILGSGPHTPIVAGAVEEVDDGWCSMPGFVDQQRLDELMAGAACLINPSRREGYGLVVVEAAGHGTPVVLVEHPGNAAIELVESGVNGHVASDDSPDALAEAIIRTVRGGSALRQSSREWFEHAIRHRTIGATVRAIARDIEGAS
ncbi:glycosyltransferase family 4 protein [Microbacterium aquimaris]|uniref:glycosyltransferase family 4 protein n=1 Tax=Microbacterium aquimaris TaxID=459816 RepID=UPI002AD2BC3A|nr:glycosyltransferase family 4 protein [Microbacterium aquimaris]MDZ8274544.1 glycosyltransferase family 4 protein [Microbacterium aquimaris]